VYRPRVIFRGKLREESDVRKKNEDQKEKEEKKILSQKCATIRR